MSSEHGVNLIANVAASAGLADLEPVFTATVVACGVLAFASAASRQLAQVGDAHERLIPVPRLSARSVFEGIVEFVIRMSDTVLGKEKRRYIPFCCALFLFVFAMNLFGLIPGFSAATDDVPINLGLALTTFAMYHAAGIKHTGLGHYFLHFFGPKFPGKPLLWAIPFVIMFRIFMFGIELISHGVRPLTLSLRLYGNMLADHTVLLAFTGLAGKFLVPVIFYCLGAFICLVQASVFTLLTMVYIKLAVGEEESHDH